MKAKACARCRQSKVRCDSDITLPRPCSRCRGAGLECVVDLGYRRQSRQKRLKDLEVEVSRLRQAAGTQDPSSTIIADASAVVTAQDVPASLRRSSSRRNRQSHPALSTPAPAALASTPPPGISDSVPSTSPIAPLVGSPAAASEFANSDSSRRELCGLYWTPAQAADSFQIFFSQCHPYLELPLSADPERAFQACPLLFWVICAVASPPSAMIQLQPGITDMVAKVTTCPPRSIEVVQALLILCMWPFPFNRTLDDPSFIYCGIATQIGFQIGLHRPGRQAEFSSRHEVLDVGEHARRMTWVACYIVNQMQCTRLGVPSSLQADYTLNQTIEWPDVPPTLASLYRIARLTSQFCDIIGAKGQSWSGLQEPSVRLDMVAHFAAQIDVLRQSHFPVMTEPVEVAFLAAKLHLWSFIFHDDMPTCPEMVELYHRAEKDAVDLIVRSSNKNLSRCPWHIARSVLFASLILVKLQSSPYPRQPGVIADRIALASQTLRTAVKTENDHAQRWTRNLTALLNIRDQKRTMPIRSRMAASLLYDTIRVMKEHMSEQSLGLPDAERSLDWVAMGGCEDQLLDFNDDWQNIGGLL